MNDKELYGIVADFDDPDQLLDAIRAARQQGYSKMEAFTPFPIHGIDEVIGNKPSVLGYICICTGLTGTTLAVLLQWWTGAVSYPLVISGKPFFAWQFGLPIMFELSVLLAAFGAVFGMFGLNKLPQLYHPVFNYKNSHGITDDRFLLVIEAADKRFHPSETGNLMRTLGAKETELIEA